VEKISLLIREQSHMGRRGCSQLRPYQLQGSGLPGELKTNKVTI
jgi:hypothetical protein